MRTGERCQLRIRARGDWSFRGHLGGFVVLEPAEGPVPEHCVLAEVFFWPSVVDVVVADVVEEGDFAGEASVVERSEDAAGEDEATDRDDVARHDVHHGEVEVLADEELEGVHLRQRPTTVSINISVGV